MVQLCKYFTTNTTMGLVHLPTIANTTYRYVLHFLQLYLYQYKYLASGRLKRKYQNFSVSIISVCFGLVHFGKIGKYRTEIFEFITFLVTVGNLTYHIIILTYLLQVYPIAVRQNLFLTKMKTKTRVFYVPNICKNMKLDIKSPERNNTRNSFCKCIA